MITRPLLAAVLAVSVASVASAQGGKCAPNPELDAKAFALWVTDKTNPDETPCAARLTVMTCEGSAAGETRTYASADGRYAVVMKIADGAAGVALQISGASGVGRGVSGLATFPLHRVIYRGIGADAVSMFDESSGERKSIGNVMLIPVENLTERAVCPAN